MTNSRMASSFLTVLLICLLNKCSPAPTDDRSTKEYLVESMLAERPLLAAKILSVLAMSPPALTSYILALRRSEEDVNQVDLSDVIEYPPRSQNSQKRGMGQCIHNCINGRGNMNFIQCKSMCH